MHPYRDLLDAYEYTFRRRIARLVSVVAGSTAFVRVTVAILPLSTAPNRSACSRDACY